MNEVDKDLIEATINYGLEHAWCDSDVVDALIGLGITKDDFVSCGYGDFVKQYFED